MKDDNPLSKLVNKLSQLPGLGEKSAERLAFHILRMPIEATRDLAQSIQAVRQVKHCPICFNLTGTDKICAICNNSYRDKSTICVVEQPTDLWALEKTGVYKGVYHVLLGRIAPLEGIGPEHLTINKLMERLKQGKVKEIIIATNPTLEGDSTGIYLRTHISGTNLKVTQLARGIPSGSTIEYSNQTILVDALKGRIAL